LDAKFGEYIVIARKSGRIWYVAGITNDKERLLEVDLTSLDLSGNLTSTLIKDGLNVKRVASDYMLKTTTINSEKKFPVNMSSGGGFILRIE
jgi:alpha-glucosidase